MKKILVVDDSKTVLSLLELEIKTYNDIEAYYATSYKETLNLLKEHDGDFHAALLDFNLPDAPDGEIVGLANLHLIPTVVLSGTIDDNMKNTLLKKEVIDVILKTDPASIKFAVKAIYRTLKNYDTTILIVDDSKVYRSVLTKILKKIKLKVLQATNGQEALNILEENTISLVLTGFEMPLMDGLELTLKIREKYNKDQLGIIALSSAEKQSILSNFLKFGANDFINKPFTENEIVVRVNSNLELLELFKKITDMANKDFLTGAYNRRYFFDKGKTIYSKNKRKKEPMTVAMIDIDKFKSINDTYGHDIGDIAIQEIKKILDKNLRISDLMARFGGEEFCVLLEDITLQDTKMLFQKIREKFEENIIEVNGVKISYTVSIGVYFGISDSLEEMIRLSDEALYTAKESGRNRVEMKMQENSHE